MDVYKFTAPKTESHLINMEMNTEYCRETVTLAGGVGAERVFKQFAVLGQISRGALSVATAKTGAGNGTVTSPAVATTAKTGVFVATLITVAANAGVFTFEDPDGNDLGIISVGQAFNLGGISGTIADGSTDYALGDQWEFTVTAATGSGKFVPVDFSATDGSQNAAAIILREVTTPDGEDRRHRVLKNGPAIVLGEELVWPVGATDAQKAKAIAQLRDLHIKSDFK